MALPLYKGAKLPPTGTNENKSLVFDKFYLWEKLGQALKDQDKEANLKRISGSAGDRTLLEKYTLQHCKLINALGGKFSIFENQWNVVFGMGIDHPLENGMVWHPILGVPYLAGSGVKGMVRAYCEIWKEWDTEKIERCFGKGANENDQGHAGAYIFFDALPIQPVSLTSDVMTPHMGKWYEEGGEEKHNYENIPGDWHTPVPVTFLAIKDIKLICGIARRSGQGSDDELEELMSTLSEALQWVGAGAKTAAGYGRFTENTKKAESIYQELIKEQQKQQEAEKLAAMSPADKKIYELIQNHPNPNETSDVVIYNAIKNGELDDVKCEALRKLKIEMQNLKKWVETSKKPEKDKKYKRTQEVMQMLKECNQ